MSLYYEAASLFANPSTSGSLRSQIFKNPALKAPPAQIYALAVQTCKWSSVLREVIENANFLKIERKVTPTLSLFLVHDLLLAKGGIALPTSHGLRKAVERHRARLQAEFIRARVRRKLVSLEAFREFVEAGLNTESSSFEAIRPRWVRINTLKSCLEDQLDTTFSGYKRVLRVQELSERGQKLLFIDDHIPNLVALSPGFDVVKSDAYKSGAIIFQNKASCFPAYLLDPLPTDGDIIDTCSAPGNKTTHIAAILSSHEPRGTDCSQIIHAFEKSKARGEILEKMIGLAGSSSWTKIHSGEDFLKIDPNLPRFQSVGALLLDPSCSGSGITGRDEMPKLHIPLINPIPSTRKSSSQSKISKAPEAGKSNLKRKREESEVQAIVDDNGSITVPDSEEELEARLNALSKFQLELLIHAFKFPAAHKITYSTCSIYAQENELIIMKALEHPDAKSRGWRILKRSEQVRGMRNWPVRGCHNACRNNEELSSACIRANKDDEYGTTGFFVAGLVRDEAVRVETQTQISRGKKGSQHLERSGTLELCDAHDIGYEQEWHGISDD
ncbi:Bgt-136 [Blumeria graminis f. sp. tritici]|uniref:Bgt-136 n=1 Tax=Blumeria graminis f. sp. tritici TaxID=62690 RepID=A0A9X9L8U5_BLUGR|nr:Bgt-136 [Blumeria graminis f. sp. tritici]